MNLEIDTTVKINSPNSVFHERHGILKSRTGKYVFVLIDDKEEVFSREEIEIINTNQ
jgi:hypothetical protein